LKLTSLLLQYPSEDLREAATAAGKVEIVAARRAQVARLREFCAWYASTPLGELQRI
jgi:nitrate reductase assembly molybdenum cofactor insertion protein NarJ